MLKYLDPPLLAQGRPCGGDGCAVTGGAEHTGGSGAAEWGLGNPLERRCDKQKTLIYLSVTCT